MILERKRLPRGRHIMFASGEPEEIGYRVDYYGNPTITFKIEDRKTRYEVLLSEKDLDKIITAYNLHAEHFRRSRG